MVFLLLMPARASLLAIAGIMVLATAGSVTAARSESRLSNDGPPIFLKWPRGSKCRTVAHPFFPKWPPGVIGNGGPPIFPKMGGDEGCRKAVSRIPEHRACEPHPSEDGWVGHQGSKGRMRGPPESKVRVAAHQGSKGRMGHQGRVGQMERATKGCF